MILFVQTYMRKVTKKKNVYTANCTLCYGIRYKTRSGNLKSQSKFGDNGIKYQENNC